ncbi:hypothetical protein [Streptomyces sp. UNOC14_S4]|uniref:hypothetical protein n=1 Tax=Streptomyces sp. UNOC14_S4 TaxID=2872340 RepID=UPI001E2B4923|nr:hypothetical protein [Streptomyces sp. UNOC14_S4]MCC3767836.1 hypothetical protein [Streptomyces sp. UNOC14_S4]
MTAFLDSFPDFPFPDLPDGFRIGDCEVFDILRTVYVFASHRTIYSRHAASGSTAPAPLPTLK